MDTETTPRASHVQFVPPTPCASPDTLPYESDEEDLIDADEWFAWFKTTQDYKDLMAEK